MNEHWVVDEPYNVSLDERIVVSSIRSEVKVISCAHFELMSLLFFLLIFRPHFPPSIIMLGRLVHRVRFPGQALRYTIPKFPRRKHSLAWFSLFRALAARSASLLLASWGHSSNVGRCFLWNCPQARLAKIKQEKKKRCILTVAARVLLSLSHLYVLLSYHSFTYSRAQYELQHVWA